MLVKVAPMNTTATLRYEIELILNQLESKGFATTKDMPSFRYFSNKVAECREKGMIWMTTGCAIEQRIGVKHVIQINPDYIFERVNGFSFNLKSRY